jgi:hypothetical protein
MRKLAPLLDLQGNIQKAKRWIPWAQKHIERLKRLNVAGLVNQTLKPINGCTVSLRSVEGSDYIRINVLQEDGKFTCDFPTVTSCAPLFCSRFALLCRFDNHNEVGFAARTGWNYWDNYHWVFGDGDTEDGDQFDSSSTFHEYVPGEYTCSLTTSKDPIESFVGAPEGGKQAEHKIGSDVLNSTAWADYGFSSGTTSNEGCDYLATARKNWRDEELYTYESQDQDVDFDLTSVSPLATCTLIARCVRKDRVVHYPNYGDAEITVSNGEVGILSSLGVFAKPVIGGAFAPWEDLELGDMTPFIGTIKNITLSRSPTAQLPQYMGGLPVPPFAPSSSNTIGMLGAGYPWVRVETPGIEATTTKVIKVNTGTPKKTRQIGESIHT